MSELDFDLDSILSEFQGESAADKTKQQEKQTRTPAMKNAGTDQVQSIRTERELPPITRADKEKLLEQFASRPEKKKTVSAEEKKQTEYPPEEMDIPKEKSKPLRAKATEEYQETPYEEAPDYPDRPNRVLNIVLIACFAVCVLWGLFNVSPFRSSTVKPISTPAVAAVSTPAPQTAEQTEKTGDSEPAGQTESEEENGTETETVKTAKYKLTEGEMAPAPNPACYGQVSVTNAAEIDNVIAKARQMGLLREDEEVAFSKDAEFNQGSYYQDIMYYLDETILAICWKEIDDGSTLSMCEIKIADGSQMRMEVYGDVYNENDNSYLSQMVMANNAVVAMNSDKCKARGDGILVWNRILYKYNENPYAGALKRYNCLDNCLVTGSGDFLFTKRLEERTTEEMQQYIADNDVVFSISFGPLLIENGEMVYGYHPGDENYIEYAFGETEKPYSRCGMGQIDERHYLYCSLNHSDEQPARWTMREFATHIYDRGIMKNFYALDGGQTAELIINNTIYNHIDYGAERYTSNCIYFATAVPNQGG